MKIWALGDTHLSFHEEVNKPMDIFGAGWENHAERIKSAWIANIGPEDVVVLPGDISWGLRLEEALPDIEWLHELPGTKIISKGNHDLWWSRINYLNSLYEDTVFLQNETFLVEGENIAICATRGWPYPGSEEYSEHDSKIYRRELLRLRMGLEEARKKAPDARLFVALHYPPAGAKCERTEFTDIMEEFGVELCLYGHLHGALAFTSGPKGMHRGIEYKLVSADYLGGIPKCIYNGEAAEGDKTALEAEE